MATFERPSVERDVRDLRKRMEALERVARAAGLPVPPWEVDYDTGAVTGATVEDPLTVSRPLRLVAFGEGGTGALGIESVSGDGTPDSGGEAIGIDMGGAVSSHPDARVHADGARAIGVQLDVSSGGADAYGVRGVVDGEEDGAAKALDLDAVVTGFGNATGAELDAVVVEGIATGLKVTATETGTGGRARAIDATGPLLLRVLAVEPPTDLAGPIIYAYDNGGTTEIRANVGGVVSVLA